jgi:hypothetical protein
MIQHKNPSVVIDIVALSPGEIVYSTKERGGKKPVGRPSIDMPKSDTAFTE